MWLTDSGDYCWATSDTTKTKQNNVLSIRKKKTCNVGISINSNMLTWTCIGSFSTHEWWIKRLKTTDVYICLFHIIKMPTTCQVLLLLPVHCSRVDMPPSPQFPHTKCDAPKYCCIKHNLNTWQMTETFTMQTPSKTHCNQENTIWHKQVLKHESLLYNLPIYSVGTSCPWANFLRCTQSHTRSLLYQPGSFCTHKQPVHEEVPPEKGEHWRDSVYVHCWPRITEYTPLQMCCHPLPVPAALSISCSPRLKQTNHFTVVAKSSAQAYIYICVCVCVCVCVLLQKLYWTDKWLAKAELNG